MSDRLIFADVIGASSLELPPDVLAKKLAAEQQSMIEVLPDEVTNARVAQEHQSIWASPEPLAVPAEFTETGRKA